MVINAMPIATTEITPTTSVIKTQNPAIGFTVTDDLKDELDKLSCFASGQDKPETSIIGSRVEIRLNEATNADRLRVNCTLPVTQEIHEKTMAWRWLGFLFHVNEPPQLTHQ
jgi:hypothetical protein